MFRFQDPSRRPRSSPSLLRRFLVLAALLPASFALPELHALSVTLKWGDNSTNESGFRIERAVGSGRFSPLGTTAHNTPKYTDYNVASHTTYRYRVSAYNSRGSSPYSNIATVTTGSGPAGNTAPTISSITDRTIRVNGTTGAIGFTINDAQTSASKLTLVKNSSNTSLVPTGNIHLGGSGSARYVTVWPAHNKTGRATIWIKVSDGRLTSYIGFVVTVSNTATVASSLISRLTVNGNTAPTISDIPDQHIPLNGSTGGIAFKIRDAQTSASNLTLVRNSSNTGLVPTGNIFLGGSGSTRYVTVRPAHNKTGWTTIYLKVSDGQLYDYIGFVVSVEANLTYASINPSAVMRNVSTSSISAMLTSAPHASPTRDTLRFGYMPLNGDTELTVRVEDLQGTDDGTRAGLMFRASTSADSICAGAYVTGAGRLMFVSRFTTGGALQTLAPSSGSAPVWLRLTRAGDDVYAFTSMDGKAWDLVEFGSVPLPDTVLAGTTVTAPNGATANTATFSGFAVD